MNQKLDKTQHSVYKLTYHLVLVTKYRRKVIDTPIYNRLMNIFQNIGFKYNVVVLESNFESDHIHILFKSFPNINLQKFVNSYKSASSRLIKKEYPKIKRKLWKSQFWKRGYFITITGGASIETIKQYIEKQQRR
jgi:putative transposase